MAEAATAEQGSARGAVTVHVNERPVKLERHRVTGLEIKEAAIAQGVEIEGDFLLTEEPKHGEARVIGDEDTITVTKHSRFSANAPDDNS